MAQTKLLRFIKLQTHFFILHIALQIVVEEGLRAVKDREEEVIDTLIALSSNEPVKKYIVTHKSDCVAFLTGLMNPIKGEENEQSRSNSQVSSSSD